MKNLLLLLFILVALIACNSETKNSISESEHLVNATAWYQQSAEMRACYLQTYQLAELKLTDHIANYQGEKPAAVVLDIDETVLDNSPFEVYLIEHDLSYTSQLWKQWTDKAQAKALPGALRFTKKAKELGIEVIYISNRKVSELQSTLKNLDSLGFPNADSASVHLKTTTSNKTERRQLVSEKYEVLLFIGDNLTDFSQVFAHRGTDFAMPLVDSLVQEFGNRFIILPNPMYGEWEGALYNNNYNLSTEEKRLLRKAALNGF